MTTKQDDQIIVSKLRPMSEAPSDQFILAKLKKLDVLQSGTLSGETFWRSTYSYCMRDDLEGWIPMPIYKPEE